MPRHTDWPHEHDLQARDQRARYRSYDCHRRDSGVWHHISPGLQLHHRHQKVLALGQPHLGELHEHPDAYYYSHEYLDRPDRFPASDRDTTLDPLDPQPHSRDDLLRGRPVRWDTVAPAPAALARPMHQHMRLQLLFVLHSALRLLLLLESEQRFL